MVMVLQVCVISLDFFFSSIKAAGYRFSSPIKVDCIIAEDLLCLAFLPRILSFQLQL